MGHLRSIRRALLLVALLPASGCGESSKSASTNAAGASARGAQAGTGSEPRGGAGAGGASGQPSAGGNAGRAGESMAMSGSSGSSGSAAAGAAGAPGTGGASAGTASSGAGAGAAAGAGGSAGGGSGGGAGLGEGGDGNVIDPGPWVLDEDSLAVRFANAIMARAPDPMDITSGDTFEYNHGIVLRGIEQVYKYTKNPKYLKYIQSYVDHFVSSAGDIDITTGYSLDNIQPAVLLPFLYAETGDEKYKTAAARVRSLYDGFPTNEYGGFWHKQSYPNQMWLDSIYMGEPFLAEYAAIDATCGRFCIDTVVHQSTLIADHVQDESTGLLRHAWDASTTGKASWADPATGVSPEVWGRALGWYMMTLADTLPSLPGPDAEPLKLTLTALVGAVHAQQDASGLWFQVVDKGDRSDNFLETSASGMFVYAIAAGVRRGILSSSLLDSAKAGYSGLRGKVTFDAQDRPSINDAVHGMGVQDDYAHYVNQKPLVTDSPHGLCAVLLAFSEMESHPIGSPAP